MTSKKTPRLLMQPNGASRTLTMLNWMKQTLLLICLFFSTAISAQVSLPNGTFSENIEDLRVKVLGSWIVVERQYYDGRWQVNVPWNSLKFNYDNLVGAVESINRNGAIYQKYGNGWTLDNKSLILRTTIKHLPITTTTTFPVTGIPGQAGQVLEESLGYRWQDRSGNWVHYDDAGRIVAYGNTNQVTVWFQYDSLGKLKYVLDHFGRVAIQYSWNGEKLISISDNPAISGNSNLPARMVKYDYIDGALFPLLTKVTNVIGYVTTYTYESGKLKTLVDAEGHVTTLTYWNADRIKSLKEADGAETTYIYDYDKTKQEFYTRVTGPRTESGQAIEETWYDKDGAPIRRAHNGLDIIKVQKDLRNRQYTDVQGKQNNIEFNEFGDIVKITYPDGKFIAQTYFAGKEFLKETINQLGVKTTYERDAHGNVTRTSQAVGTPNETVVEYTYNSFGLLTSSKILGDATTTDATTTYEYDDLGNLTKATDAEGRSNLYSYDHAGNLKTVTDPHGQVWTNEYDNAGNLTKGLDPLGHQLKYEYNKIGVWVKTTDQKDKAYTYQYDPKSRLTKSIDPLGATTSIEYDSVGRPLKRINAVGGEMSIEYDSFGRLSKFRDNQNNIIQLAFDDEPTSNPLLPKKLILPTYERQFEYNDLGVMSQETVFDGTQSITKKYAHDAVGKTISYTNPYDKNATRIFDEFGRVTKETDTLGNSNKYTYDKRDNLITLENTKGQQTKYEYDRTDRLTKITRPLGQISTLTYNPKGLLEEFIDAKGQKKHFSYDVAGRHIKTEVYGVGTNTDVFTVNFTYDQADRLIAWTDGAVTTNYTYDDIGRKLNESVNYGSFTLSHAYLYNLDGSLKSFTYTDGLKLDYQYDANQNLSSITIPNEGAISYSDYQWLVPKTVLLPGGNVKEYTYDGLLRSTSFKGKTPGQVEQLKLQYTYGKNSEIKSRSEDGINQAYQYDDEGQLTQVSGSFSANYTLDALGNRTNTTGSSNAASYDANNRLLVDTAGNNYQYDDNGNLTQKTGNGITQVYRYDVFNRLVQVEDATGAVIATYGYDIFDRRLWKQTSQGRTYFQYANEGLIAELDATGQTTARYGWKPNSFWSTDPVFIERGGEYAYYYNNAIGSPVQAVNKEGDIVWKAQYNPFGAATVLSSNETNFIESNLRLAGQYYDAETGLHYNYRRYYNPTTGRYLTEDPIGYAGGNNLYLYAEADPVNNIDPTGEILPLFAPFAPAAAAAARGYVCCVLGCKLFTWMDECSSGTNCYLECLSADNLIINAVLCGRRGPGPKVPAPSKGGPKPSPHTPDGQKGPPVTGHGDPAPANPTKPGANEPPGTSAPAPAPTKPGEQGAPGTPSKAGEPAGTPQDPGAAKAPGANSPNGNGSSAAGKGGAGTKAGKDNSPKSDLPRKNGDYVPHPDAEGPHSTIGTRQGSDGQPYRQGATFDGNGNFRGRTDVTDHGSPQRPGHVSPHHHPATGPASTGPGIPGPLPLP